MSLRKAYVSPDDLRDIFDRGRYSDRARSGELTERELVRGRPSLSSARPPDAISRRVAYYDDAGSELAVAHELTLPDGTIVGSGRPDPMRVHVDGTLYISTARFITRRPSAG
jgi:hypothetical protein